MVVIWIKMVKQMAERRCSCFYPERDEDYSICMRCFGQLGSYYQCLNCIHKEKTIPIINVFKCKQYGWQSIKQFKKIDHCAMQNQKYGKIMKKTRSEFIEPILIKAGDIRLKLGFFEKPPCCDVRVITEENYQLLKRAYDKILENEEIDLARQMPLVDPTGPRILPKVSKEKIFTTEIGYHKQPIWVLILFGMILFFGIVSYLFLL